jgi:hypothetical protein
VVGGSDSGSAERLRTGPAGRQGKWRERGLELLFDVSGLHVDVSV